MQNWSGISLTEQCWKDVCVFTGDRQKGVGMKLTREQENRIEELIREMTLDEKIGQMNLPSISIVGGFNIPFSEMIEMMHDGRLTKEQVSEMMKDSHQDYQEDDIRAGRIGAMMVTDASVVNRLQKIALKESRLGIPLLIGLDVIHGFYSVYPIALAEACSFDEELFEQTAAMAARESRSAGVNWHFAPMLDIARDARWGRCSEGPGEDPYLASLFAAAKIRGLQGNTDSYENYVAACVKHFAGYGACEGGRDYNTTAIPGHLMYNVYLAPFEAAVKSGAVSAMAAFNDLNGTPCTVNRKLLRETLKERFGMSGFIVSDANAIRECVVHGAAENDADAGIKAVTAGMDMDMNTAIYLEHLAQAVNEGKVSMDIVDDAVRRILRVKMWLGLFDDPYIKAETVERYKVLPDENRALARRAAEESIVLLKNEHEILPLKPDQKISLVGALADMPAESIGAWAASFRKEDLVSIKQGFENGGAEFKFFPCGGPEEMLNHDEIREACAYGDVIVAVVGEKTSMSGEASSRSDITLPGEQRKMLEELAASGKPVVAVLLNGRALALGWEAENIPAIVEAWHLGIEAGNAVFSILSGRVMPQGRLSVSIPRATGQCPVYYNHPNTGRPASRSKFTSKYIDLQNGALYPFGYGLTYTSFEYSGLDVTVGDDTVTYTVTVKNTGSRQGTETVQFYSRDVAASIVRPVKELKAFKKVQLDPGAEETVSVSISLDRLGFYDNDGEYRREDGTFLFYAGGDSGNCLSVERNIVF